MVKKSLAAPLKDETPWVQAVEDSKVALSSADVKEYQSPPLKSYLKLRSGLGADSDSAFKTNYDARLTLKEDSLEDQNGEWNQEDYDVYKINQKVGQQEDKVSIDSDMARKKIESMLYYQGTVYGGAHNNFAQRAFHAVIQNNDLITKYSREYSIPEEVIASIVLEEQYVKSAPDSAMVLHTLLGGSNHSTGLGAIQPRTAKEAWDYYAKETGKDFTDILPTTEVGWSYSLATDNDLNVQTICLVLAMEAKRNGVIDTYDELSSLSTDQWSELFYHYNGSGSSAEKYSERIDELLPMMKIFMEDLPKGNPNTW